MSPSFARARLAWVAVLLGLVAVPHPAAAAGKEATTAPGQKTVRELIESATKSYQDGDYDKAASEYFAAYEKKPLAALLFNVAQSHRKAGRFQEALTLYERFLKEDPKSTLVPEAEAHATAMRAQIEAAKSSAEREAAERLAKQRTEEAEALARMHEAERQKAEAALLLSSRKTEQSTPVYKKAWFWVVIGGVVAAGVATTVAVVLTRPQDPSSDLGVRVVQF
jgi:tetratricopeptide (TPR) repeat protein